MFSFHKPRVYRSTEGCCICRAKSSSSRFTDSKKYEDDSIKCFNLDKPRKGEICNACVLLVKRYKRLPAGSGRHWGHVVDARIGPGMKSMIKFKKNRDESEQLELKIQKNCFQEKFAKIFKKKKVLTKQFCNEMSKNEQDLNFWNNYHQPHSTAFETFKIKCNETDVKKSLKRKLSKPRKNFCLNPNVSFVDEKLWKIRKICCGLAYENSLINAIIIDLSNLHPCQYHSMEKKNNIFQKQIKHNELKPKVMELPDASNTKAQNTIVLKKHQLYFKRQFDTYSQVNLLSINDKNEISNINNKNSILHKIKTESGKLIRNSIDKINLSVCINSNNFKELKNSTIKTSMDLRKLDKKLFFAHGKNVTESSAKFSDNSSDSGFDENMVDRKSVSPGVDHTGIIKHQ